MSEWQPIETAPTNVEVLCYVAYGIGPGDDAEEFWVDYMDSVLGWVEYAGRIDLPFPPTHWMPLPEPPK